MTDEVEYEDASDGDIQIPAQSEEVSVHTLIWDK